MSLKRRREKDLDGLSEGMFDALQVAGDTLIQGNLTVIGTINDGGDATIAANYTATDSSNQYRSSSSTIDLKSTGSTTPTFRFRNSSDATGQSIIETGVVSTTTVTA